MNTDYMLLLRYSSYKKYSQINHCRMTLERYTIMYDYYARREYKKYNKRKTSEVFNRDIFEGKYDEINI